VTTLIQGRNLFIPNVDEISQSTADILLLPVSENKRPPYWNFTSGFKFDLFIVISMTYGSAYQISYKSNAARQSYAVISSC